MILENRFAALATLMMDRLEQRFGDLSPRAAALLVMLRNRGPLTVSRLAAIAGTAQPTATRLVDGLAARGLVSRGAGGGRDGRQVAVSLTAAGRRRAKALEKARGQLITDLLGPLGKGERENLQRLIDKMLHAATTSRAGARFTCRYCDLGRCTGAGCPVDQRATEIEAEIEAVKG